MTEEDFFAQHAGESTDELLISYCLRFHGPYFNIEEVGVRLTDEELRADLLHCLYHDKPKDKIDEPDKSLIALVNRE